MDTAVIDPQNSVTLPSELVEYIDAQLTKLSVLDRQGEYVKFQDAFDVILDIRQKVKSHIPFSSNETS